MSLAPYPCSATVGAMSRTIAAPRILKVPSVAQQATHGPIGVSGADDRVNAVAAQVQEILRSTRSRPFVPEPCTGWLTALTSSCPLPDV